jgi:hypothetical protein
MTNSNLVDKIKSTVETAFDMQFDDVYSFEDLSTSVKTINHEAPDNAGNIDIEFPKQVQADLTQNDESALDHVKCRTHWKESNIEVLPKTETPLKPDYNGPRDYLCYSIQDVVIDLIPGEEYTIEKYSKNHVNGVARDVSVAIATALNSVPMFILGDYEPFMVEDHKLEPFDNVNHGQTFTIVYIPQFKELFFFVLGGYQDTPSLAIYQKTKVHKLDNDYLDLDWLPTTYNEKLLVTEYRAADFGQPYLTADMVNEGQRLIIYWDHVRYETVVVKHPFADPSNEYAPIFAAGNLSHIEDGYANTGEPFALDIYENSTYPHYGDLERHTLSIYTAEENKLPDNYIPDDVVRVVDDGKALVIKSSTVDSTKMFKITVDDSGTLSATPV